ncbi:MAG TPA: superoxide dismutase, partial [Paludibacteraceae bacterium]|nr:superoxide dismutase [Paludibacteraceae bacterium]
ADIQLSVRNNGGGYYNHCLYWSMLAPAGFTTISPKLEKILIKNFGSIETFKTEFEKAALGQFGSGWAWLIKESSGKLRIISTPNQDNTLMPFSSVKGKPVLALDVWEHAYYLKYQSKRAAYVKAFWNVVNWKEVEKLITE